MLTGRGEWKNSGEDLSYHLIWTRTLIQVYPLKKKKSHTDTKKKELWFRIYILALILAVLLWLGRNFHVYIVGVRLLKTLINTKKSYVEPQNSWALKGPLEMIHSLCLKQAQLQQVVRTVPSWILSASKDADSTSSLSNLFQCLIILTVRKFNV